MYASLMPDLIAIDTNPAASVRLAARAGFTGLDVRINRFADEIELLGAEAIADAMAAAGLRPGYCSLTPQKIGVEQWMWDQELADLARRAEIAQELGYTRATSVVLPFHEELTFEDNARLHVDRIRRAADVLADYGIAFGLEYVSPLSRRAGKPYPFVHDLDGLLGLLERVDRPNTGVMLDCFHWHCAGETADTIRRLRPEQVVAVHVNDLVDGVPVDEQVVTQRELPGETGIIDIRTFLATLREIGYDGPVTAEPTHPKWSTADAQDAAGRTASAILGCLRDAGVPGAEPNPHASRGAHAARRTS